METDEQDPEVNLAKSFIEHLAGELGPPEIEPGKHCKDDCSKDNVVEVGNHEVAIGQVEVQGW